MKNHFSNCHLFKKGEISLKTFCETKRKKKTRKSFTKSAKKLPIYQCGCKKAFWKGYKLVIFLKFYRIYKKKIVFLDEESLPVTFFEINLKSKMYRTRWHAWYSQVAFVKTRAGELTFGRSSPGAERQWKEKRKVKNENRKMLRKKKK